MAPFFIRQHLGALLVAHADFYHSAFRDHNINQRWEQFDNVMSRTAFKNIKARVAFHSYEEKMTITGDMKIAWKKTCSRPTPSTAS